MEERIAILIDGDNISPKYAEHIRKEAEHMGRIKISRLYGSISSPSVRSWYSVMPGQGITPMLQISYANGKSIADQALTIDAMDILYSGQIDTVCLVSSDSDFTKLVYRLKEAGITVIGMGEKKTNESLVKACDEFRLLDLIYNEVREDEHTVKATSVPAVTVEEPQTEADDEVMQEAAPISVPTLDEILAEISDYLEDDWQNLASVGIHMSKRCPGFDARIYGYRNFSDLIKKNNGSFELKSELAEDKIHKIMYVKKK
jgi:uncharacterized protein (TIGR00288 family)